MFKIGLGLIRRGYGNIDNIVDLIPVDFVADYILVISVKDANKNALSLYQCGTSDKNP